MSSRPHPDPHEGLRGRARMLPGSGVGGGAGRGLPVAGTRPTAAQPAGTDDTKDTGTPRWWLHWFLHPLAASIKAPAAAPRWESHFHGASGTAAPCPRGSSSSYSPREPKGRPGAV